MGGNYVSNCRNKLISRIFKEIEWIERYGTGIRRVMNIFKDYGSPEPVFENFQHGFRVIAYSIKDLERDLERDLEKDLERDLGKNSLSGMQKAILDQIKGQINISEGGQKENQKGGQISTSKSGQINDLQGGQISTSKGGQKENQKGGQINTSKSGQINDPQGGQISLSKGGQKENQQGGQKNIEHPLTKQQKEILQQIRQNPKISRNQLSEILGINSSAVQKHFDKLKGKGIIRRKGADRGGIWIILSDEK
jgi:predicted HTH transcriptional regulator